MVALMMRRKLKGFFASALRRGTTASCQRWTVSTSSTNTSSAALMVGPAASVAKAS